MADLAERIREFLEELRRRRVFRVAAVYAVVAWVVIQVAVATFPVLLLPSWMTRAVVVIAAMGFPVAVALAWAFRISAEEPQPGSGVPREGDPPVAEDSAPRRFSASRPVIRGALVLTVLIATVGVGLVAWQGWLSPVRSAGTASARTVLDPLRIGVLYFDDHSPAEDLGPVANGFTEALIHELSQVEALDVVSRNGMKPYREPDEPLDSVARALGTGRLVEGSVEQFGDRLRVHVQLIDGTTASHLSSRVLERSGSDLLALRDEIVDEVVRLLRQELGEELELREQRSETEDAVAWELFHRARRTAEMGDSLRVAMDTASARAAYAEADSLLARADRRDRGWAAPTVLRGWIEYGRARLAGHVVTSLAERHIRRGISHADRVLGENPDHPRALELRGALRYRLSHLAPPDSAGAVLESAERDLRRAVEREPGRAAAWAWIADLLITKGRYAESRLAIRASREADPFLANESDYLSLAASHALQVQDVEEAWTLTRDGLRQFPENPVFRGLALLVLAGPEAPAVPVDSAWSLLHRTEAAIPGGRDPHGRLLVAGVLAKAGLEDSARAVRARAEEAVPGDPIAKYYAANVHLLLGSPDSALRSLEEALEAAPQLTAMTAEDWWWDALGDDPRFAELTGGASATPQR